MYLYIGQLKNKIPHGYGTYIKGDSNIRQISTAEAIQNSITIYSGEWIDGVSVGKATIYNCENKYYYYGQIFVNHLYLWWQHGEGEEHIDDEVTYKGQFKKGWRDGYGEVFRENYHYIGEMKNSQEDGRGVCYVGQNIRLEGTFRDGMPHGICKLYSHDILKAYFQSYNGVEHGYCIDYYDDGSIKFQGYYTFGKRDGLGVSYTRSGVDRGGFWVNDILQ